MIWLSWLLLTPWPPAGAMSPKRIAQLRRETIDMFYHGYDNYMKFAFPEDEVRSHGHVAASPVSSSSSSSDY